MTGNTYVMKQPPDKGVIQEAAAETGIPSAFIEKDWYAIQALSAVAAMRLPYDAMPVFAGGTSLSKGHGLIRRFSEDLDFKVVAPTSLTRGQRREIREAVLSVFEGLSGIKLERESVVSRDGSSIFSFNLTYPLTQDRHSSLRQHLLIEMSFKPPALPPEQRPLRSFITEISGAEPDAHIACVSPLETSADKLSALIWRVLSKDRTQPVGSPKNEPAMIRHLHDLCALSPYAEASGEFAGLVFANYESDKKRGGLAGQYELLDAAQKAREKLADDKVYQEEYAIFVDRVSYDDEDKRISFSQAMASLDRLIKLITA